MACKLLAGISNIDPRFMYDFDVYMYISVISEPLCSLEYGDVSVKPSCEFETDEGPCAGKRQRSTLENCQRTRRAKRTSLFSHGALEQSSPECAQPVFDHGCAEFEDRLCPSLYSDQRRGGRHCASRDS